MKSIERDLVEKPILFVTEDSKEYAYNRSFTASGLPFYTPPPEKNCGDGYRLHEFIFLPISNSDFKNVKDKYFFGFRYLISNNKFILAEAAQEFTRSLTSTQLQFEISRIRYYPSGDKHIVIDRFYDPLFPTQAYNIDNIPSEELAPRINKIMNEIVDLYCNWYIHKTV